MVVITNCAYWRIESSVKILSAQYTSNTYP